MVETTSPPTTDLIRAIVHDLRNPLTAVKTALDGVIQDETDHHLSPNQQAMLNVAYLGVERMMNLIEDAFNLSRLEDASLTLDYTPISLTELIIQTLQIQTPLASQKNIQMEHIIPQFDFCLQGDKALLIRVLQNLIDNALKFSVEGSTIQVLVEILDSKTLVVSVIDNGEGIDPTIEAQLFEKFVTTADKSYGFGLFFCKLVIQAHGGKIWAENNTTGGAKFTFTLPVEEIVYPAV